MQAPFRPTKTEVTLQTTAQNHSDEQLLVLVAQKEPTALETLYDRHAQAVFQVLLRFVHDPCVAEELLQETFWQVWQKADQYHNAGAGAAWLFRIARNKAIDHLRWQKSRGQQVHLVHELAEQTPLPVHLGVESTVERMTVRCEVQEALKRLPGEQRLCLELAYFQGLSQSEIASHTNTPLGTIKTRMRIGMEKLGRLLVREAQPIGAN